MTGEATRATRSHRVWSGLRVAICWPPVKAVLFVVVSLGLWVALAWAFRLAYVLAMSDGVMEGLFAGQSVRDFVTVQGDTLDTRWLLLFLPVGIWISALIFWPPGRGYGEE